MVEISIIMPVYNSEDFLKESIESILNQTFADFEFICIDDGSTDNSLEILQSYEKKDERMKVFHQENMGGGTARNKALEKTNGNYLLFIDSDDVLYSNALKETYDLIREKEVDFLLFKAINYDSDSDKYYEQDYFTMGRIYNIVKDDVFSYEDIGNLIFRMSATPWGKLYDLNFIKKCGAQFAEGIIFHDNIFFWDMLFSSKRIYFYNETLYMHRKHEESIQGSKDKRFLNIFPAVEGIVSMFIKHGTFDKYKNYLYNWKLELFSFRYTQIQDEYKYLFLDEFKKDLSSMTDSEGYEKLMEIFNPKNKKVYENAMNANTYIEYDLAMENYYLNKSLVDLQSEQKKLNNELNKVKKKNLKLKTKNNKLKEENKKIKKEYDKIEKLNKEITDSKSWKITKPLRSIKNRK